MRGLFSFSIGLLSLTLCSCITYRPQAIDLRRDTEQWLRLSQEVAPPGCTLGTQQMRLIGLLFNPELSLARLSWVNTHRAARYAGLWEDPGFDLGGERDITEHVYNFSLSPTLSLPVTGVPHLAKRVAQLYSLRDYLELTALEQDYLVRLDVLADLIRVSHAKLALMRGRETAAAAELESHRRLQQMGEISASELYDAEQRFSSVVKERQEQETEHLQRHLELISMLGLHPAVGQPEIAGELPSEPPIPLPVPSQEQLMRHPRLLTAMAAHLTTEEELHLEIRKQYPTLQLSPGYTREDGDKKLTFSAGFTLPLWNRNREAIVRASGSRDKARVSVLQQWRELVQQVHALALRQELLTQHCRAVHARMSSLLQSAESQEKLHAIGEISLPVLAATRHATYTDRLAYLDCLAELLEVRTALHYLQHPSSL